ncbi:LLM class flavin-dependent oxidoreductase, partial [Actinomadura sp. LOL_011]
EGDYYKLYDAVTEPKPVQNPRPVVMNAGFSPAGRDFASNYADVMFIPVVGNDDLAGTVRSVKEQARAKGREVVVWGNVHVASRDTEAELKRFLHHYIEERGDLDTAAKYYASLVGADGATMEAWRRDTDMVKKIVAGAANETITGTPDQVVEQMAELSEAGIDGLGMGFVDYNDGVAHFRDSILPVMRDAGLRTEKD